MNRQVGELEQARLERLGGLARVWAEAAQLGRVFASAIRSPSRVRWSRRDTASTAFEVIDEMAMGLRRWRPLPMMISLRLPVRLRR